MKLESDKNVVCDGSCNECVQYLRLYPVMQRIGKVLLRGGRGTVE